MKKTKLLLASILVSVLFCTAAFGADFGKSKSYNNNFKDIPSNSWYADSVATVYEIELMEGVSDNTFDAESEMSVAQAITIAARLHSIYNETEIPEVSGSRWFQKYVDYCLAKGIMKKEQFDSYSRSVLSFEMVQLFAAALPKEYYPKINTISSVHDVPEILSFANDVLIFYNAGILNGNDAQGNFLPMSPITRKRAAVIISRTALKDKRLSFSLPDAKKSYSYTELFDTLDKQTVKNTLDEIVLATFGNYKVSAGEYRYYSFLTDGNKAEIEKHIKQRIVSEILMKESGLTISRETFNRILASYYASRYENYSGLSYFEALDAQKLTDSVFARLAAINELTYETLLKYCNTVSHSEVYEYAKANGYVCAKQIFISDENDDAQRLALEVQLALASGESFDALLEKYGEDEGMKSRKCGYIFTRGTMSEPFESKAFALKEGETSGVIETDNGYIIIKRMPYSEDDLASSPDYATVASAAGSVKYNTAAELSKLAIQLKYIDNFDAIAGILE